MAEHSFQEVVKQWRRMCMSFQEEGKKECKPCMEKCPAGPNHVCCNLCEAMPEEIEKFEVAVMKWAEEHPARYPTWIEYLTEIGVIPEAIVQPILDDIAQKLKLELREGK